MKKLLFIISTIILIGCLPLKVSGSSSIQVTGRSNVINTGGYIDFNTSPHNSNVVINENGIFSGYAWSSDFGWIDFTNGANGGPVRIDFDTGAITGKAVFVNTGDLMDFSGAPNNSNARLDPETGEFSGYLWSSDLGWISFTGVNVDPSQLPATGLNIYPFFISGLFLIFCFILNIKLPRGRSKNIKI